MSTKRNADRIAAMRARIQTAARPLFARGYASTSVEHIARQADTSVGAIYLYFESKDRATEQPGGGIAPGSHAAAKADYLGGVPPAPATPPDLAAAKALEEHLFAIANRLHSPEAPDMDGMVRGIHGEIDALIAKVRAGLAPPDLAALTAAYERVAGPVSVEYDRRLRDGYPCGEVEATIRNRDDDPVAALLPMDVDAGQVPTIIDTQAEALATLVNAIPGLVAEVARLRAAPPLTVGAALGMAQVQDGSHVVESNDGGRMQLRIDGTMTRVRFLLGGAWTEWSSVETMIAEGYSVTRGVRLVPIDLADADPTTRPT